MDDLLDLVNDDLFDMSKSFEGDDLLEDLDSMDLIHNISCDFVDDIGLNPHINSKYCTDKNQLLDSIKLSIADARNDSNETAESKLMKIRQILESTTANVAVTNDQMNFALSDLTTNLSTITAPPLTCPPHMLPATNRINPATNRINPATNRINPATTTTTAATAPIKSQKYITPKPIVTSINNNDIIKNPTLAATLIDIHQNHQSRHHHRNNNLNNNPFPHDNHAVYTMMDNHRPPRNSSNGSESPNCSGDYQGSCNGGINGEGGVRKTSHNAIEKRYRLSINDKIDELRHMLFEQDDGKMNKSNVLKKAIDRIRTLENENNLLRNENYKLKLSLHNRSSTESPPLSSHQSDCSNHSNSSSGGHLQPLNNCSDNQYSQHSYQQNTNNKQCGVPLTNIYHAPSNMRPQNTLDSLPPTNQIQHNYNPQTHERNAISNNNNGATRTNMKRPLICESNKQVNNGSGIKNEKLARLLLTNVDEDSNSLNNISYNHKDSHSSGSSSSPSSTLPNFLLCTLALFIVSFEPINFIMANYQLQQQYNAGSGSHPSSRHLLQLSDQNDNSRTSNAAYFLGITLIHWCSAIYLIWRCAKSRSTITKTSLSEPAHRTGTSLINSVLCWCVPFYRSHVPEVNTVCSTHNIYVPQKLPQLIVQCMCFAGMSFVRILTELMERAFSISDRSKHDLFKDAIECHDDSGLNYLNVIESIGQSVKLAIIDHSSQSFFSKIWNKLALVHLTRGLSINHQNLANSNRFLLAVSMKNKYFKKYLFGKVDFQQLSNHNELFQRFIQSNDISSILAIIRSNQIQLDETQLIDLPIEQWFLLAYSYQRLVILANEMSISTHEIRSLDSDEMQQIINSLKQTDENELRDRLNLWWQLFTSILQQHNDKDQQLISTCVRVLLGHYSDSCELGRCLKLIDLSFSKYELGYQDNNYYIKNLMELSVMLAMKPSNSRSSWHNNPILTYLIRYCVEVALDNNNNSHQITDISLGRLTTNGNNSNSEMGLDLTESNQSIFFVYCYNQLFTNIDKLHNSQYKFPQVMMDQMLDRLTHQCYFNPSASININTIDTPTTSVCKRTQFQSMDWPIINDKLSDAHQSSDCLSVLPSVRCVQLVS